jgi:hypothetical protein
MRVLHLGTMFGVQSLVQLVSHKGGSRKPLLTRMRGEFLAVDRSFSEILILPDVGYRWRDR